MGTVTHGALLAAVIAGIVLGCGGQVDTGGGDSVPHLHRDAGVHDSGAFGAGGAVATGGAAAAGGSVATGGVSVVDAGIPTAPELCTSVPLADPVIEDFEHGADHLYPFDDGTGVVQQFETVMAQSGAPTGQYALRYQGTAMTSWGAGFARDLGCVDVSSLTSIGFFLRGNVPVSLQATEPKSTPITSGGTCDEAISQCYDHPSFEVDTTEQWQEIEVQLDDMHPLGWGTSTGYGTLAEDNIVMMLQFQLFSISSGGDWWFEVDHIRAY